MKIQNKSIQINFVRYRILVIIFSLMLCIFNSYGNQNWFDERFEYRKTINISNAGSSDLINFPIYLNLSYDSKMQSDFDDILFTSGECSFANSSQLNFELDNYSSSINAHIWINVLNISASGAQICMYYGNSTISSLENISQVWNSDYVGVWHFEEKGTVDREDSTENNYHAVPRNYDNDEKVTGVVGNADSFDGINDYTAIRNLFYNSQNIDEISVCVWFKTGFVGSSYNDNWAFLDFDRSEFFNFYLRGDSGALGFSTHAGGVTDDQTGLTSSLNDDTWHYGCAVYDGVNKIIYLNGFEDGRDINTYGGLNLGRSNTRYGFIGDGSESSTFDNSRNNVYYQGSIDEIFFLESAQSPQRILEWYNSMSGVNTVIFGSEEERVENNTIVSNSSLDFPFFTNSSNPQELSLLNNESVIISFPIEITTQNSSSRNLFLEIF